MTGKRFTSRPIPPKNRRVTKHRDTNDRISKNFKESLERIDVSPVIAGRGFTRTKEDFVCEHCAAPVAGDGYTNHCSKCLWSKHVDINPGDRSATCGGMMEPVGGEVGGGTYIVLQRCDKCGHERKNKLTATDDIETFTRIIAF